MLLLATTLPCFMKGWRASPPASQPKDFGIAHLKLNQILVGLLSYRRAMFQLEKITFFAEEPHMYSYSGQHIACLGDSY